jgi:16S rRNA processing protein RimM
MNIAPRPGRSQKETPLGVSFYQALQSIFVDKNKTHLEVGVISKPHGVRGELKVRLHNEDSTSLDEVTHVVVEPAKGEVVRYEVESVRGNSKGLILALRGVDTMELANDLRGAKIWVERAAVSALEPGEYYLVDLVGCQVELEGKPFAVVKSVRPDPTVDTMVIQLLDGSLADVPIVDAWVGQVDISAKKVQLLSTDGLIEN